MNHLCSSTDLNEMSENSLDPSPSSAHVVPIATRSEVKCYPPKGLPKPSLRLGETLFELVSDHVDASHSATTRCLNTSVYFWSTASKSSQFTHHSTSSFHRSGGLTLRVGTSEMMEEYGREEECLPSSTPKKMTRECTDASSKTRLQKRH